MSAEFKAPLTPEWIEISRAWAKEYANGSMFLCYNALCDMALESIALKLDAGRYRWLRNESASAPWKTPTVLACCPEHEETIGLMITGEFMDAAIDAARKP